MIITSEKLYDFDLRQNTQPIHKSKIHRRDRNLHFKPNPECFHSAIFLKQKEKYVKIEFSNILFIEADSAYSKIVTSSNSYYLSACLKNVLKQINSATIIRCQRGYAINLKHVKAFNDRSVFLGSDSSTIIPIGSTYRKMVLSEFRIFKSD